MTQLVTGEAVALDLRPAALPSRLLAGLVDALAQGALLLVLAVTGALLASSSDAAAAAYGVVLLVLVLIVYPVAFETVLRGRTPGKMALGLRAVRDDGGPVAFRQALVRGLFRATVDGPALAFVPPVLTMLLSARSKRLGDLLAGTVVVQERVPQRGGSLAFMPPPLAGWAAGLDLTGLSDDLALQARQFVSRAGELDPAAREQLGGRIVAQVSAAVRPEPPPGTPGWAVLAAVLAERRARDEQRLGLRPPPGHGPPQGALPPGYGPPQGAFPPGYGPSQGAFPPGYGPPQSPPQPPAAGPQAPAPPSPSASPYEQQGGSATGSGGFVAPS